MRITVALIILLSIPAFAAEKTAASLLDKARAEFKNGHADAALPLATRAIESNPNNADARVLRAVIYSRLRKSAEALADFDEALKLAPMPIEARIRHMRGCEHFYAGHFKESIDDFDQFVKAFPDQEPYLWQRGIAYYYAGRFADGRSQFELHKTVNPEDVENAAWHYLCVARIEGVEKARAALITVNDDSRVPMKEIFKLFKGEGTTDEVLAAARAKDPPPERLKENLMYAHLYLGLYFEAAGKKELAAEHIFKAADDFAGDDYMSQVARVHAALLRK